jgi:hypothetical protein
MNGVRMSRLAAIVSGCVLIACTAGQQPRQQPYAPVFANPANAAAAAERGTLKGDYDWAAGSSSLTEAASRWREFVAAHSPADGEYEDEFQMNHVNAGKFELMRAYYLLGQTAEGDAVLKEINPLGL